MAQFMGQFIRPAPFPSILAIFGGRYCYYFRPFRQFSEGGIFVICDHFGRFDELRFTKCGAPKPEPT